MRSVGKEIINGLEQFLDALKKDDLSQFKCTKIIKNKDGTFKRIIKNGKNRKNDRTS